MRDGYEDPAPFAREVQNATRDEGEEEKSLSEEEEARKWEERLSYFIEMLSSDDVGKRWKAAEALARMGDTRAVDPLIHALEDEDWRVKQKVVWALGYIGDPRAVQPLRRAYRNETEGVQEMITEALEMIVRRRAGQSPNIWGTGE
jgi:HEAT repeat protein